MYKFQLAILVMLAAASGAAAQTYNSYSGGYNTGYGTVYGSFGLAMATQNIYNTTQMQIQKLAMRQAMINKWGKAAVEKAEREAAQGKAAKPSNPQITVSAPPVARKHGIFRPDATVDTAKAMADALGETAEEKALIKQIFTATKAAYIKEVSPRGWQNDIAGAMTFFTATAMTIYHESEEPSDDAAINYHKAVTAALDEMPEFAKVTNRDKQAFSNMLIGFSGMLLAIYTDGKQNNDAATIENAKKLAAVLTKMVLKTDVDNIRLENGQIVIKS